MPGSASGGGRRGSGPEPEDDQYHDRRPHETGISEGKLATTGFRDVGNDAFRRVGKEPRTVQAESGSQLLKLRYITVLTFPIKNVNGQLPKINSFVAVEL